MVEARVIAGQIAEHLRGKKIASAELGERKKKSMRDALYRSRIHPKKRAARLTGEEIAALHQTMREVVRDALAAGGRASERDLFDRPGGFEPAVSKATEGQPCPRCGTPIQAIGMGGAGKYYICPGCQVL